MIISTLINCRTQVLTWDSDIPWEITLWIEQLGFDHSEKILIPTQGISETALGRDGGAPDEAEDDDLEEGTRLYLRAARLKSQQNQAILPSDLAFQFPSDGRGCFRLLFSPKTSRFLCCAVELEDELFEVGAGLRIPSTSEDWWTVVLLGTEGSSPLKERLLLICAAIIGSNNR